MPDNARLISMREERVAKVLMRWYSKANVFLYRLTGGRIGGKFPGGAPVCLVTMLGRKSGKWRTTPLIHIPHGDDVLLVASQGGLSKNPVWYNNLRDHPVCTIVVGYSRRQMIARQADEREKAELWPAICAVHPGFSEYQQRTPRDIPVMVCSPVKA